MSHRTLELGCLEPLDAWDRAFETAQDRAIAAAAERLGGDFQWTATEVFRCGDQQPRMLGVSITASGSSES